LAKLICQLGEAADRHTVTAPRFDLRRQVQFTGPFKVLALQLPVSKRKTALSVKRLQQFVRFQAK
jgi:hypothetical protein